MRTIAYLFRRIDQYMDEFNYTELQVALNCLNEFETFVYSMNLLVLNRISIEDEGEIKTVGPVS